MKNKSVTKTSKSIVSTTDYAGFIANLKQKIQSSQFKAALSVNQEMIRLYWEIGKDIVDKQKEDGWGSKVIERVAKDLQNEFPGIEGFSRTNIGRMRAFYLAYSIYPQAVGKLEDLPFFNLPWGHNIVLLESLKDINERLWYAYIAISEGWSRYTLIDAIKVKLHKRQGKAITNFHTRLPSPQSHLAHDTLKDPYHFDFLELTHDHIELDLEDGLLNHVEKFMREMGQGFSLVGRQLPLKISDRDFYIDLLFYHLKLRCFVVVELKATDFKPEYAGKMNFYLSAVDDLMRHPSDNPTIGILICKKKDNFIVEYALRDIHKPMGVAEYETKIVSSLPNKLKGHLPTIEDIEAELSTLPANKRKKRSPKKKRT
ncbi:MAG TPA: PDDEXK nuclease domain-containing protein [Rhabdochlamydiaceae bacterium]|nr:PDDEXK nuclease domain-containing protein [Rhabdochlamydiaceae bacterium]